MGIRTETTVHGSSYRDVISCTIDAFLETDQYHRDFEVEDDPSEESFTINGVGKRNQDDYKISYDGERLVVESFSQAFGVIITEEIQTHLEND